MAVKTEQPRASADQLRAARTALRTMATRYGLSGLRLVEDGTLFVHIDSDPGYGPLLAFVDEATKMIGAEPNVVSDETPAAVAKLPAAAVL